MPTTKDKLIEVIHANETDPVFAASEAARLVEGDKDKLDNAVQPGTSPTFDAIVATEISTTGQIVVGTNIVAMGEPNTAAIDVQNRALLAADGGVQVDWAQGHLIADGNEPLPSVNWIGRELGSGSVVALEWYHGSLRANVDGTAMVTLDWSDCKLFGHSGSLAAVWVDGVLRNSQGDPFVTLADLNLPDFHAEQWDEAYSWGDHAQAGYARLDYNNEAGQLAIGSGENYVGMELGSEPKVFVGGTDYGLLGRAKLILGSGSEQFVVIDSSGITLKNLPTSDPEVEGALWNDNGTVKISAGA